MKKHCKFKRTLAGFLAVLTVAGYMPANVVGFLTGGAGIVASAAETYYVRGPYNDDEVNRLCAGDEIHGYYDIGDGGEPDGNLITVIDAEGTILADRVETWIADQDYIITQKTKDMVCIGYSSGDDFDWPIYIYESVFYVESASTLINITNATVNLADHNTVESITIGDDEITDLSGFDITYGTDDSHTATVRPTTPGTYYAYVTAKNSNPYYTGTVKSDSFEVPALNELEELLTVITPAEDDGEYHGEYGSFETVHYTVEDRAYLIKDGGIDTDWYSSTAGSLTVTPAKGYTITRITFTVRYPQYNVDCTLTEAPFKLYVGFDENSQGYTSSGPNGTGTNFGSGGPTSITVYGYKNNEPQEDLLTSISTGWDDEVQYSVVGPARLSFSGDIITDSYWGWSSDTAGSMTLTASKGYTITRVEFDLWSYDLSGYQTCVSGSLTEAPFTLYVGVDENGEHYTSSGENGTGTNYDGRGPFRFNVYGYKTPSTATPPIDITNADVILNTDNSVAYFSTEDDTIIDLSGFDISYGTDNSHKAAIPPTIIGTYYAYVTAKDNNPTYTGTAKVAFEVAENARHSFDYAETVDDIPTECYPEKYSDDRIYASDVEEWLRKNYKQICEFHGLSSYMPSLIVIYDCYAYHFFDYNSYSSQVEKRFRIGYLQGCNGEYDDDVLFYTDDSYTLSDITYRMENYGYVIYYPVADKSISNATVNLNGNNTVASLTIGETDLTDLAGFDITYGTDDSHTLTTPPNTVGTYYAYVTANKKNATYFGMAKSEPFEGKIDLSEAIITMAENSAEVTSVQLYGKTLTPETDYSISYGNGAGFIDNVPTKFGRWIVYITGIGNYKGEARKGFSIDSPEYTWLKSITYEEEYEEEGISYNVSSTASSLIAAAAEFGSLDANLCFFTVRFSENGGTIDKNELAAASYEPESFAEMVYQQSWIGLLYITTEAEYQAYLDSLKTDISEAEIAMVENEAGIISVLLGETTLNANDYTVSYKQGETFLDAAPTMPGNYTLVITGKGNYKGSAEQTFTLTAEIWKAEVTLAENSVEIVSVKYQGVELIAGTDYGYRYKKNGNFLDSAPTEPGNYTVFILGNGCYTGYMEVPFSIAADITNAEITFADNFTAVSSVILGGKTLIENTDYTITYKQSETVLDSVPTIPGNYTVVITGKGEFTGSVEKEFMLTAEIWEAEITLADNSAEILSVTYQGIELIAGTDYSFRYRENGNFLDSAPTEPGNYMIYIIGTGCYTSSIMMKFSIEDKELSNDMANAEITLAENSAEVSSVKLNGKTLIADNDYTVAYKQSETVLDFVPTIPGNYTVVITGKGEFTGSAEKAFKLTVEIWDTEIMFADNSAQIVSIQYQGIELIAGTDYTVRYKMNGNYLDSAPTVPGNYIILIIGTGCYTNAIMMKFTIEEEIAGDLANAEITLAENSAAISSVILNGKTLIEDTDYIVSYKQGETVLNSAPTMPGNYTIVITGKGNYKGSAEQAFKLKAEIWEAEVTLAENSAEIVSVKYQSVELIAGTDYGYRYKKNGNFLDSVPTEPGDYSVIIAGNGCYTGFMEIPFSIKEQTAIIEHPKDYSGAVGETATFTVTATGTDLTYQWQFLANGVWTNSGMNGAKTATLSVEITEAREGQQYRCVVSSNGTVIHSTPAKIIVTASVPVITAQPKDYSGAIGDTAKFTVSASGKELTYQWQFLDGTTWKNSGMNGANTATLNVEITASRNGQKYRCIVSSNGLLSTTSNEAKIVITESASAPVITAQPKDYSGAIGDTAKFTVSATGKNLTYQWQFYSNSGWQNSGMTGAKTATLNVEVTAARNGQKYRCIVSSNGLSTISNEAKIVVTESASAPVITAQPKNYSGAIGNTAKFTVSATGKDLTYQWQFCDNGTWKKSGMTGAKTATLNVEVTAARNGQKYRCVISSNDLSTTSNEAKIIVTESASAPVITAQPKNYSGAIGNTAKFIVAASGTNLTYQWQFCDNGTWKNSGMTGAKTATLIVEVTAARNGQKYRCIVSSNGLSTISNEAKIIVSASSSAPVITAQPQDYYGSIGSIAKFTVSATSTNVTYQWQFCDNGTWKNSGMTGAKTATLNVEVTAARNGQQYRCVVTSNGMTVESAPAKIIVTQSTFVGEGCETEEIDG